VITPEAVEVDYPTLLGSPAPRLRSYPRETVIAEKLEALVQLGLANSRMKDFYDLIILSRLFEFDGELLVRAIRATFGRRETPLPPELPVGLTPSFSKDPTKIAQWTAFLRKSDVKDVGDLAAAVDEIGVFLSSPLTAAARDGAFSMRWNRAAWT
jgi:hypothetical protein